MAAHAATLPLRTAANLKFLTIFATTAAAQQQKTPKTKPKASRAERCALIELNARKLWKSKSRNGKKARTAQNYSNFGWHGI